MGIEYRKEFFDREYSLGETYCRIRKCKRCLCDMQHQN